MHLLLTPPVLSKYAYVDLDSSTLMVIWQILMMSQPLPYLVTWTFGHSDFGGCSSFQKSTPPHSLPLHLDSGITLNPQPAADIGHVLQLFCWIK